MTHIDTNVILRWLLDDDKSQSPRATRLIEHAEPGEYLVTDVILGEIFYILRGKRYARQQLSAAMYELLNQPAFIFDQERRLDLLFTLIAETKLDFADCYLIARAVFSGSPLETFDKPMLRVHKKYRKAKL
jgi:predicted nucleic-acid-binding protein